MSQINKGSCLCGAISFEVSADIPKDRVRVSGENKVTWYQSPEKKVRRGFCSMCGSSLFWDPMDKDWIGVSMGAFDTPTNTKLKMHVFVANKGDYYDLTDGLPQFNPPGQ